MILLKLLSVFIVDSVIIRCNLFLGLGMDSYVCVGRLHGVSAQNKRHVWIMTREADGSVRMWETSRGSFIEVPQVTDMY